MSRASLQPIALAALLVSSVVAFVLFQSRSAKKPAATTVPVTEPKATPAQDERTIPCRIVPRVTLAASTLSTGVIDRVLVNLGDTVTDGQVLAILASPASTASLPLVAPDLSVSLQQAHRTAQALQTSVAAQRNKLAQATTVFTKQELLNREGATPRLVFEAAKADRDRIAAELAQAEESSRQADNAVSKLEDQQKLAMAAKREQGQAAIGAAAAEIHAPAGGMIVERNIEPGWAVTEANRAALFRITPHPEWLKAEFDERLLPGKVISLNVGTAQLSSAVGENGKFADFESRTTAVRPGSPCSIKIGL